MKIIKKGIPIYFGWLRIVITKDFVKAYQKLVGEHDKDLNVYEGFVTHDRTKKGITRYTVFINPKCRHTVIAHEVVHLVNALYRDRGMHLDLHNDETQAYLTGWFTGQIYRALKHK